MAETEDYDKSATPTAHKTSHQDGGTDEISVAALLGQLVDSQPSTWTLVSGKPSTFPPDSHALDGTTSHSVPTDNTNLNATTLLHGLMPKLDKVKLDGVEAGATKYPDTGEQAFLDADHSKLDAIEAGATKYPDTGEQAFLDADHSKLDAIEAGATKYPDTGEQAFLDADHSKLDAIEAGATKYPDTGEQAFTDADHTKLDGIEAGASPGEGHITIYPWNISSTVQGTWGLVCDPSQALNFYFRNSTNAQNDQITFKIFLAAGAYFMYLMSLKSNDSAIITVLIDDVSQGTIDLYAGSLGYNQVTNLPNIIVTTSGLKAVSLKLATRNDLSTGWRVYISGFSLFRTS